MEINYINLVGLITSVLSILILMIFINKNKTNLQLRTSFRSLLYCLLICCIGLIFQIILSNTLKIPPIYFDYFVYIGTCFLPISLFFTSLVFSKTKLKFRKKYILLFIIPIISLLVLWTNEFHNLFYKEYNIYIDKTVFGDYFIVHSIYSYIILAISVVILLKYSIKNSGFFSKQSVLIVLGTLVPLVVNILGTLGIIKMTVYITPMSFTLTILLFAMAIFKFKFLDVTPIALQNIVDRISDSYVVVDEQYNIVDYNKTFIETFMIKNNIRSKNIKDIDVLNKNLSDVNIYDLEISKNIIIPEKEITEIDKYFNIEITPVTSNDRKIGTLILFKDVTQHILDVKEIKEKQDMIMERDRLASLGQLIGGISHNLKTPIMSISGATEGLLDLVKEYENSVGVSTVTVEDHHEIANDMRNWIEKIKVHLAYMSDIITAVKGQAVNLNTDITVGFTIDELVKRVNILMKHELKNALINLNIYYNTDKTFQIKGDVNSLVQVINNLITNAIQAYDNPEAQNIDFTISKENSYIIFAIKDYANGIPKKIQENLFKQMITTKGKNGTGLGLYMSYSTIKGQFNGDITFETQQGKGTTFYIKIPC